MQRLGDPVALFRADMMRAAQSGKFSCRVQFVAEKHGSARLWQNPEIQDWLGEALGAQGVTVKFGEPHTWDDYPSLKLDWYSTRRVVKVAKVVRQEKSAEKHGLIAAAPHSKHDVDAVTDDSDEENRSLSKNK